MAESSKRSKLNTNVCPEARAKGQFTEACLAQCLMMDLRQKPFLGQSTEQGE